MQSWSRVLQQGHRLLVAKQKLSQHGRRHVICFGMPRLRRRCAPWMNKMKRAGIVMRVSTLAQEENYSLPDQERHGRDHAQKMGYTVDERHIWNDGAQKSYT